MFIFSASGLFLLSCSLKRKTALRFDKNEIRVGKKNDTHIFICSPNEEILGRKYGIELIDAINGDKNLYITIGKYPDTSTSYKTVIISGSFWPKNILNTKSEKYVLLNPTYTDTTALEGFFKSNNIFVVLGEITDFANICQWKEFFSKHKYKNYTILNSTGNYIPDWATYIRNDK